MTETEARTVVLLQAVEAGGESPLWTDDDRRWATRAARQDAGAGAFEAFVVGRARHAMQRLLPRDAASRRWLQRGGWRRAALPALALAAFVAGAVVDHLGAPQRVDLLAPPVWAVVAWNLVVYALLLLPHPLRGPRSALAKRWLDGSSGPALLWAKVAAPLAGARAALLLHAAAAAFALGIVAGMYLRGLVLDYRAGWQSTFLEPAFVQGLLGWLLAPARALTGIPLPDVAPLRVGPGTPASASAAPWIHLYAATLALAVVLPRMLLSAYAGWRAGAMSRRFPLALDGPYFEPLRAQAGGGALLVQVLPHALAPSPQAVLGLQSVLATAFGESLQLRFSPPVAAGDEALVHPTDAAWHVLLFDLTATPESESHGRLVAAIAGRPQLVVCDEGGFARRFAHLPDRLAERRAAWQRFADAAGTALVSVDLEAPDLGVARHALKAALSR